MGLGDFTRQASSFLYSKYTTAKRVLNDVSPIELLLEEATNGDPSTPSAKTMRRISDAAFEFEDYWRIVEVLHKRLHKVDFKEWRQSYKALVVLDYLLTHGPERMGEEFYCDMDVVEDLGSFQYIDHNGFDWGSNMQKKAKRILLLLANGDFRRSARSEAFRVTSEIKGFGSSSSSPRSPVSTLVPSFSSPSSPTFMKSNSKSTTTNTSSPLATLLSTSTISPRSYYHCEDRDQPRSLLLQTLEEEIIAPKRSNMIISLNLTTPTTPKMLLEEHLMHPIPNNDKRDGLQLYRSKQVQQNVKGLMNLSDMGKVFRMELERQLSIGS